MYLDDPGHRLYEKLMETHFGNHPLSMSMLGLGRVDPEARSASRWRSISSRRYGPGNMVLGGHRAARFRPDRATGREVLRQLAAGGRAAAAARAALQAAAQPDRPETQSPVHDGHDARAQRQDERRFAARVLADVIGDTDGSRFYWALVDNAIAEDADFGFYPHDGCGSFYISLTTDPTRTAKALDIAMAELEKVKTRPEGRRSRARQEQDRQQPRAAAARCRSAACAPSAGSGSTTSEYRSLEQDMETLISVDDANRCGS